MDDHESLVTRNVQVNTREHEVPISSDRCREALPFGVEGTLRASSIELACEPPDSKPLLEEVVAVIREPVFS